MMFTVLMIIIFMKKNTIVKRNDFLKCGYTLTIMEQRLLLACISQVNSRNAFLKEQQFEVTVQQIKDIFGDENSKQFYRDLRLASKRLFGRKIVIKNEDVIEEIRWVWKVSYHEKESKIVLNFSPDVIPYLSEITERFTKYKLDDVKDFKCIYSLRLYELFAQFQAVGSREISIYELRQLFDLGNKYKLYSEFKRCVIDKALHEINLHSNLTVSYGERKRGRSVTTIQFSFETKMKKIDNAYERKSVSMNEFVRLNPLITKGKTEAEVLILMKKNKVDKK